VVKAAKARKARSTVGGKKWIQKAIKNPGALTRQAKSAGMSVQAFARAHAKSKGTAGKRSRLALTLNKMSKRK
jgi:hypothetical protein